MAILQAERRVELGEALIEPRWRGPDALRDEVVRELVLEREARLLPERAVHDHGRRRIEIVRERMHEKAAGGRWGELPEIPLAREQDDLHAKRVGVVAREADVLESGVRALELCEGVARLGAVEIRPHFEVLRGELYPRGTALRRAGEGRLELSATKPADGAGHERCDAQKLRDKRCRHELFFEAHRPGCASCGEAYAVIATESRHHGNRSGCGRAHRSAYEHSGESRPLLTPTDIERRAPGRISDTARGLRVHRADPTRARSLHRKRGRIGFIELVVYHYQHSMRLGVESFGPSRLQIAGRSAQLRRLKLKASHIRSVETCSRKAGSPYEC
ncbi:hypothetical protein WME96_22815 [Sorangium sp. So ce406]